ncbi:MAG: helix-turn-helix domain-containing protein [Pseudomonadota bacterium]
MRQDMKVPRSTIASEVDNLHHQERETRAACNFIKSSAALVFDVSLKDINAKTRQQAHIAFARQVAMYVAHVRFGLKFHDVAKAFGRDRTTVGYACRLVEDRRDNPSVDFLVDCMERGADEWLELAGYDRNHVQSGWYQ